MSAMLLLIGMVTLASASVCILKNVDYSSISTFKLDHKAKIQDFVYTLFFQAPVRKKEVLSQDLCASVVNDREKNGGSQHEHKNSRFITLRRNSQIRVRSCQGVS